MLLTSTTEIAGYAGLHHRERDSSFVNQPLRLTMTSSAKQHPSTSDPALQQEYHKANALGAASFPMGAQTADSDPPADLEGHHSPVTLDGGDELVYPGPTFWDDQR